MSVIREKSVAESAVTMSQLMRPNHANFSGRVHGGVILSLMDEVAYTCATKFSEQYCVTVAVDRVEFLSPVSVGEVLTLTAKVRRVGRSSMDICIVVTAEDPRQPGSLVRSNRCHFTMVALDEQGQTVAVPALRLETDEDRTRNCEATMRRELSQRLEQELEQGLCRLPSGGSS